MQITTTYVPPTDTTGSFIRATGLCKQATIPYPYELSGEAVHRAAAEVLARKLGRTLKDSSKPRKGGNGYVFYV